MSAPNQSLLPRSGDVRCGKCYEICRPKTGNCFVWSATTRPTKTKYAAVSAWTVNTCGCLCIGLRAGFEKNFWSSTGKAFMLAHKRSKWDERMSEGRERGRSRFLSNRETLRRGLH